MLKITINDDKSVTLHSDDRNAENAEVDDAFTDIEFHDLAKVWNNTEMDDNEGLTVTFPPKDAPRVFDALDSFEFMAAGPAIDEARAAYESGKTGTFQG